jgi:hypothetical protein
MLGSNLQDAPASLLRLPSERVGRPGRSRPDIALEAMLEVNWEASQISCGVDPQSVVVR